MVKLNNTQLLDLAYNVVKKDANHPVIAPLLERLTDFSAWDRNEYESRNWCSKYAPATGESVMTTGFKGEIVKEWLQNQFEILRRRPDRPTQKSFFKAQKKKVANDLDDFIVENDLGEDAQGEVAEHQNRFLILSGPSGSSKSSAVYGVAAELGAYVMELNASDKRSSKKLMEKLGGMGKSHLVHRANIDDVTFQQNSVILLDEVDILFEEDQTFWLGLDKFVETSRRPVIMTCNDPDLLPPMMIENHKDSFVTFEHASTSIQSKALWTIALCEGHLVSMDALKHMIRENNNDFRSSLNDLQFWCQMALGDRKSGINWILTDRERKQTHQEELRIISKGTYIGGVPQKPPNRQLSLDEWCTYAESLSTFDFICGNVHTQFERNLEEEYLKDRIMGFEELELLPPPDGLLDYEFTVHPTLYEMSYSKLHRPQSHQPSAGIDKLELRDALWSLQARGIYSCADVLPTSVLATDLAPVIRNIARSDKRRVQEAQRIREHQGLGTRRSIKSAYKAMGLQEQSFKQYLEGDLDELIDTGAPAWNNL